jgi:putative salt-induced outer membrane protein YdiY
MKPTTRVLAAIVLHVFCATTALARAKTDVITLYNGDTLTGEVKSLQAGIVEYGTDAMGTVKVEWKEIAQLESTFNYEVRLSDGTRYFGTVEPAESRGDIRIRDIYGYYDVAWLDVVELRPIEKTFIDRLDIYLSAGLSYDKASSVAQTTFNAEISYEDEITRNSLTSRTTVTDTDTKTTRSNRVNFSRQRWTNRQKMFGVVTARYENSDEQSLDGRYTLGYGLGRYFIDTNRSNLSGGVGAQVLHEEYADGGGRESVEMMLGTSLRTWRFDTPELDLRWDLSLYPSLTETGRLRGDSELRFRWEIIEDLFWDISAWASYDNETGDETGKDLDWGLTTGMGWTY